MPPAARLGDLHTCPMQTPGTPPIPHVGGPIMPPCCPTVLIAGQPAARATDMALCVGPPAPILKGATTTLIAGLPAARMGDPTAHGGTISMGCPTVLIDDGAAAGAAKAILAQAMAKPSLHTPQTAALREAAQEGTPMVEHCPLGKH